jgi:F-type H+-transporting ATPase subunit gamma
VVYSEFKSALTQYPRIRKILPITPEAAAEQEDTGEEAEFKVEVKFLYEPSGDQVLEDLLPKYVEVQLFRALLESSASEHGARMTAMDGASRSASEMIDSLTLKYNRLRQAAITKELMEIISGAESLKS